MRRISVAAITAMALTLTLVVAVTPGAASARGEMILLEDSSYAENLPGNREQRVVLDADPLVLFYDYHFDVSQTPNPIKEGRFDVVGTWQGRIPGNYDINVGKAYGNVTLQPATGETFARACGVISGADVDEVVCSPWKLLTRV